MIWRDLPASLDGVALSHRMCGSGAPILMVHGVGPGTTGRANFAPLFEALVPGWALHLIDLAGFGASGRLRRPPFFDVAFWLRQIHGAIERIMELHRMTPLLIGNSVGGALVLKAAASCSDIRRVLAIGAPACAEPSAALRHFWAVPRTPADLAAAMRPMTGPQSAAAPHLVAERFRAFHDPGYAEYFGQMVAEPADCLTAALLTPAEAARLNARVALMHGRLDRACSAAAVHATLADLLPRADLLLLGGCGHNVVHERPADVLAAVARLHED